MLENGARRELYRLLEAPFGVDGEGAGRGRPDLEGRLSGSSGRERVWWLAIAGDSLMRAQEGTEARRVFVEGVEIARQCQHHGAADLLRVCAALARALDGHALEARSTLASLAESVSCPWLSGHAALWSSVLGAPWRQASERVEAALASLDRAQRQDVGESLAHQALEQALLRGDQGQTQQWMRWVRSGPGEVGPASELGRLTAQLWKTGLIEDPAGWEPGETQEPTLWGQLDTAEAALRRGAVGEGRQCLTRVLGHAQEASEHEVAVEASWLLGVTQLLRSEPDDALHRLERARRAYEERLDPMRSMTCSSLILVGEAWSGRMAAAAARSMEVRTPKDAPRLQETARLAEHIFTTLQAGGRVSHPEGVALESLERGPLEHLVLQRIARRIQAG